jgi:hypothetical protein
VAPVDVGAELVLPLLPVPADFAGALADTELDAGALLDTGGDDLGAFAFGLVERLADGHGGLEDPAAALTPADLPTGAALPLTPG